MEREKSATRVWMINAEGLWPDFLNYYYHRRHLRHNRTEADVFVLQHTSAPVTHMGRFAVAEAGDEFISMLILVFVARCSGRDKSWALVLRPDSFGKCSQSFLITFEIIAVILMEITQ